MASYNRLPRMATSAPIPVVLVGGISLVRTLGLAGIPAVVATSNPEEPALASRHCTRRYLIPCLDSGAPAAEALAALGGQLANQYGRRVPLMYGSDDALELINAHRERLERYYLLVLNDPDVGGALIAKDRFQAFAADRRLPVPRSLSWTGRGAGSVRAARGPVVAKPSEKTDWHASALCQELFDGDGKALVFASGAEAAAHPGLAAHHRALTFQEYVPGGHGDLWSYHGFSDREGRVIASFTGRKVRTFPAVTGESAFIEIAHDASLEAAGRDVAERCPLKGFFKMDFKRDAGTGRWFLLEINARCNLWQYLGAVNGVNLMRIAYDYLLSGARPEPVAAEARYRWLSFELDYRAFREMSRAGEITAREWIGSILRSRNVYNLFSLDDPAPWLFFWRRRLARRLARGSGRVALRWREWRASAS
jgi:predicted ATP-grasp superfamily ATP-dependent carboligase